ncbi:glycoside hydrolase family 15 protein [Dactylosporangium sp. NBC_01737]|uniref:glycoside hydrolase family 15 protein n=1 Tax=Dactylosporangium sp. NBC_01737 TaxID=2975959 RepID=UPI002E147942|nr:glycoside hydrolase family 15 protein [Dactylosporangium sp. NBC_01737]
MDRYPDIGNHGLIGDLQTAALVSGDGTVDWFCCPRFDSPSVFASLLDADQGGYCRVRPDVEHYVSRQLYLPDTAMLITRFMTPDGVGEVADFMPVAEGVPTDRHRLVRMLRTVRGTMRFMLDVRPRFDYGRAPHKLDLFDEGAVFSCDSMELTVHPVGPDNRRPEVERDGDDLRVGVTLREGETAGMQLESMGGRPRRIPLGELEHVAEETARFWRDWVNASTYRGRWREMVARSAISLKLMTYAPTGAPVAAPTAGLPEQVGGERNWDYRYTWIRDGSFSVHALLGLGYTEEAAAFGRWLRDRTVESAGSSSGPLKIMYRVDGSSDLSEETLEHFEGWRGSRPVRIGNNAADQLQLDIYGEGLDALYTAEGKGLGIAHQGWVGVTGMMDWLCDNWDQPDEGVWETRGGRQDFTYGRFQCWVALDRAIRLADAAGRPADVARWRTERDAVYRQIMSRGWNERKGTFTQHYGSDVVDAALLLMPLTGFVSPTDPMWLSTMDTIERELVSDSLVYRYNPGASPDGLRGHEGTFSICTFWYVDALARAGRLTEARLVLQKMLTYANPLGLYSEEIGLTGEQLGNFPQAFSHLSLINAAINLDQRLDDRDC